MHDSRAFRACVGRRFGRRSLAGLPPSPWDAPSPPALAAASEEGAAASYHLTRANRSAYCEFELFFRQDVAQALNTSIDRVSVCDVYEGARVCTRVYDTTSHKP